jgi:hypothetical protein
MTDMGRQIETRAFNEKRRAERERTRKLLEQERQQGAVQRFRRMG